MSGKEKEMSTLGDAPMMAPSLKHYTFNVQCFSGQWKNFECDAENFRVARQLLEDFIKSN